MRQYKLSPAYFYQLRRKMLLFSIPFLFLGLIIGIIVIAFTFDNKEILFTPIFYFIIVFIHIILIVFAQIILRHKQRQLIASYQILIDNNSISRKQDGLKEISIRYDEISKIIESPGLGLDIYANNPSRWIGIPLELENYNKLRIELSTKHEIKNVSTSWIRWIPLLAFLIGLLSLLLLLVIFLSPNIYVVIGSCVFLFVYIVISQVRIQTNPNVTKHTKRILLLGYFGIFISLIIIAYIRINGITF